MIYLSNEIKMWMDFTHVYFLLPKTTNHMLLVYCFHFSLINMEDLRDCLGGDCHQLVLGISEGVQGQLPLLLPLVQILVQRLHELGASHLCHQLQSDWHTRLIAGLKIFQLKYHLL